MPKVTRALHAGLALILAASPAIAEPGAKITAVRIGLPPGERAPLDPSGQPGHVSKFAAWAPVYVEFETTTPGPAKLVIEAPDADEATATLSVDVDLSKRGSAGPIAYVRPAGGSGEITLQLRNADGTALSEPFRIKYLRPVEPLSYVVLSLNSNLHRFDLPRPASSPGDTANAPFRGGRVLLTAITNVEDLPDQWLGYDAADLVVLTTSRAESPEFLGRLFGTGGTDADRRRGDALLEWVRRGGRLVLTTGVNAGTVAKLSQGTEFGKLLPAVIDPTRPVRPLTDLPISWSARESNQNILRALLVVKSGTFPVASLSRKPERPGRVVIPAQPTPGEMQLPTAVQSAYGLGRVTLVGFDLDIAPFTDLPAEKQAELWDWVLREGGANRASSGLEGRPPADTPDDEDELATALRTHTDTFDGLPVVSFGWVALFIALYILLIGPVEYYFLKRVLRRLELTWLTFPIIVVTVSLAAYLTASAVKGRELKVNKIDVLDVDVASGRVYGTSWVTVFSPRIQSYNVGVTAAPGLTAPDSRAPGAATVGWVGASRQGRSGLVRRSYRYHVDPVSGGIATGLTDVPIQVWSTKSFTANWSVPFDPAAPVAESRLIHPPGDSSAVVGTFVTRLPVPALADSVAFYAGKAYPLGVVATGVEVRLLIDPTPAREIPAGAWLQTESQLAAVLAKAPTAGGQPVASGGGKPGGVGQPQAAPANTLPLWGFLFHEAALRNDEGVYPRNASLRRLDQSWRLNSGNRDEVIIVGRVLPPVGPAEQTLNGSSSPSRLWLSEVPGSGERTPLTGSGRQETYIRIYLPVRPAGTSP